MDREEKIRAFLALPLGEAFEASVRSVVEKLKNQHPEIKWVQPSQIHVTLHFFGPIESRVIPKISDGVVPVTQKTKPLKLSLQGMGGFPSLERPRVIWGGIEGEVEALTHLWFSLEERFTKLGFECEKRTFKPHLTLGRVREGKRGPLLKNIEFGPTEMKLVSEIALFKSILSSAGPKYEKIETFSLSAA